MPCLPGCSPPGDASPLPRLLFVMRNREHQSIEMVAASLAADNEMLPQIECGERDIRDLGANGVASWIQHLGVASEVAIPALRLTFLRTNADQASASVPTELSEERDKFVGEVADLLQG